MSQSSVVAGRDDLSLTSSVMDVVIKALRQDVAPLAFVLLSQNADLSRVMMVENALLS